MMGGMVDDLRLFDKRVQTVARDSRCGRLGAGMRLRPDRSGDSVMACQRHPEQESDHGPETAERGLAVAKLGQQRP
jgi:hypothetical protein